MNRPPIPRDSMPPIAGRLATIERELDLLKRSALESRHDVEIMRTRSDTISNELANQSEAFGRVLAACSRTEQDVLALKNDLKGIQAAQGSIVLRLDRLISFAELVKSKSFWNVASEVARLVAVAVAVGVATYAASSKNESINSKVPVNQWIQK